MVNWVNEQNENDSEERLKKETDIRVIDQRIGMGIGGLDTVIRLYHKPTGILIEMPKITRSQFVDRLLAYEMLEYALVSGMIEPEKVKSDDKAS
jgi:protein subunit release factor A